MPYIEKEKVIGELSKHQSSGSICAFDTEQTRNERIVYDMAYGFVSLKNFEKSPVFKSYLNLDALIDKDIILEISKWKNIAEASSSDYNNYYNLIKELATDPSRLGDPERLYNINITRGIEESALQDPQQYAGLMEKIFQDRERAEEVKERWHQSIINNRSKLQAINPRTAKKGYSETMVTLNNVIAKYYKKQKEIHNINSIISIYKNYHKDPNKIASSDYERLKEYFIQTSRIYSPYKGTNQFGSNETEFVRERARRNVRNIFEERSKSVLKNLTANKNVKEWEEISKIFMKDLKTNQVNFVTSFNFNADKNFIENTNRKFGCHIINFDKIETFCTYWLFYNFKKIMQSNNVEQEKFLAWIVSQGKISTEIQKKLEAKGSGSTTLDIFTDVFGNFNRSQASTEKGQRHTALEDTKMLVDALTNYLQAELTGVFKK